MGKINYNRILQQCFIDLFLNLDLKVHIQSEYFFFKNSFLSGLFHPNILSL